MYFLIFWPHHTVPQPGTEADHSSLTLLNSNQWATRELKEGLLQGK